MPVKRVFLSLGEALLAGQPFMAAPLFLNSVFGWPASWLVWPLALLPIAFRCWKERRLSRRTPFDIPIIVLMLGLLVGTLSSPNESASLHSALSFLACILAYYGFVNNSQRASGYWLFTAVLFLIGILATSAIYFSSGHEQIHLFFNEWVFRATAHLPKFGGSIVDLSLMSTVLAPLVPIVLALALSVRLNSIRLVATLAGIALVLLLFISGSGSGWIAALVGVTVVLGCWRPVRAWWLVPLYAVAILMFVSSYYDIAWLRYVLPVSALASLISLWSHTLNLLQGKAFTGLGLGQWSGVYGKAYGSTEVSTHSSYIQFVADFGFIGILSFLLGALSAIKVFRQILAGNRYDNIWFAVGIGLIGAGVTGATQAIVESSFSVVFVLNGTFIYAASPVIWFWASMLVVCRDKLAVCVQPSK